ncbi:MAG: hypothetical protein KAT35_03060 [Candidatus Aenigmarchaeota archaeon]|nr:hypothetical protein [Candidatus Aenigmarchaeota archaeon]
MHGSWFDRFRAYPPLIEWELGKDYNDGNGLESIKTLMQPRFEEAVRDNNFDQFMSLMPFVRTFAQRMGYTP